MIVKSFLSLLGRLGPQLHHDIDQPIKPQYKSNNDAHIPPAIVLLLNIQCSEKIAAPRVLADLTTRSVCRVEQSRGRAHALLVNLQIFATCLVRGWVKDS